MNRNLWLIATWLCFSATTLAEQHVELNGLVLQGSLLRGKVEPNSTVTLNGKPLAVAKNGAFLFGFSREETQSFTLNVNGTTQAYSVDLQPEKREYRIQRIDGLEQSKVTPPREVLERIRNDAALVRKARSEVSDLNGFQEVFIWPSEGVITGVYGSQRVLNGKPSRPHYGIDIASPQGTLVVAPASGKVTMAHPDLYYSGGTIIIDHGLGLFSTFLHMHQLDVAVGDTVQQGQKIGEVGSTGRSTGAHLDWRINWLNMRLDAALLVEPRTGLDYVDKSLTQ